MFSWFKGKKWWEFSLRKLSHGLFILIFYESLLLPIRIFSMNDFPPKNCGYCLRNAVLSSTSALLPKKKKKKEEVFNILKNCFSDFLCGCTFVSKYQDDLETNMGCVKISSRNTFHDTSEQTFSGSQKLEDHAVSNRLVVLLAIKPICVCTSWL